MNLLDRLSSETGLRLNDVRLIMKSAPDRYKEFRIPKRRGGFRDISQPAREVKLLQRALVSTFLQNLPIHPAATAYMLGKSIRDNALAHVDSGALLKMDFKDFFPSIKSSDWLKYCDDHKLNLSEEELELSASLIFKRNRGSRFLHLAIGAPSSPQISNIIMAEFDEILSELVSHDKVIYTRYADDLTFSAPRLGHLRDVEEQVRNITKKLNFPKLQINTEKTKYVTKKFSRRVTGMILTNDGTVTIGRDRKRIIYAQVHHALQGKLDRKAIQELNGMLSFVNSVEPDFLSRLCMKYGYDFAEKISRVPLADK